MADADASAPSRIDKALEARFPSRMVPDLERMRDLMDLLGQPQRSFPSVHITGTNGKTTTARMIDTLLRGFGLRTGRYTSPHLESVTERIALDGQPLDGDRFAAAYDDVAPFVEMVDRRHPDRVTFFELLTAMAFATFADTPVDVAVIEVGLGGRWDATNVIDAPVTVMTSIGLDHVGLLGDTVEQIAAEKAGIVHAGSVLVTAGQPAPAAAVLTARVAEVGATMAREGVEFAVASRVVGVGGQMLAIDGLGGRYDDLYLPLYGAHQATNAAVALAAVEAFFGAESRGRLDVDVVRSAFAEVTSPGRLEVMRAGDRESEPVIILDGAHNPAGAAALAAAIGESFTFERLVAVLAVLDDKDAAGLIAELAPVVSELVVTSNSSPRALSADSLGEVARAVVGDEPVTVADRLEDALDLARRKAGGGGGASGGGVLVTGSIVTVGEARALLAAGDGR